MNALLSQLGGVALFVAVLIGAAAADPTINRWIIEAPQGAKPTVTLERGAMSPGQRMRIQPCDQMQSVSMGPDGVLLVDCGGGIDWSEVRPEK